jgi:hypothetical protein
VSKELARVDNAIAELRKRGLTYGSYFDMATLREIAGLTDQDETKPLQQSNALLHC